MSSLSYYQEARPEMLRYLPDSARTVLDVGCGAGIFGKSVIAQKPCHVVGVERHTEVGTQAGLHLHKVHCCPFDERIDFEGVTFDAIFFNDVLEHMIDPGAALVLAKSLLANGGVVISSIPNVRHFTVLRELLFQKDFIYRDAGILDRTHLRFFTSKSIQRMYIEAGFAIVRHEGINEVSVRASRLLARYLPLFFGDILHLQFATVATRART